MKKRAVSDSKPLRILYACAELSPLASTGGLGEVAHALPHALYKNGHDVRVVIPAYSCISEDARGKPLCAYSFELGGELHDAVLRLSTVPGTTIPLYLIENNLFFDRERMYGHPDHEYEDNAQRFCFFSMAALKGMEQVGWQPDIAHSHDWHAAAIPVYLRTLLAGDPFWNATATLHTIHNIAYQGQYHKEILPRTGLSEDLFTIDCLEYYGDVNLMKAGIAFADYINTVSPQYAKEIQTPEYGAGLEGFLQTRKDRLVGILNGVDYTVWNPTTDPYLCAVYSADNLNGKQFCKRALRMMLGLPEQNAPLIVMVSRLEWQKGIDLVIDAMPQILRENVQMAMLGSGQPHLEQRLLELAERYPQKLGVAIQYHMPMSHQFEAGGDFFLMPSRFEPCGLSQMYSLAYGTVPIVRRTGGLADSVRPVTVANLASGRATGIVFNEPTPAAIARAVRRALSLYADQAAYHAVQRAGMHENFSWDRSSAAYVKLYKKAIAAARKRHD